MMRTSSRKWLFGCAMCLFVLVSLQLYHSIDMRGQEQRIRHEKDLKDLQKLEGKLKSLEGEIKNNDDAMTDMKQKLRAERVKIKELETAKIQIEEKKVHDEVGVLQMPKKPEQIEKEEQNKEEAIDKANEEEQAMKGVIEDPRSNQEHQEHIEQAKEHIRQEDQAMKGVIEGPPDENDKDRGLEQGGGKVPIVKKFFDDVTIPPAQIGNDVCMATMNMSHANSDVQMLDMYSVLPFDDIDGGVWKQGFDIKYDKNEVKQQKRLEVIVTPHSHNDPGWLTTFEGYYTGQTKDILDNMLDSLETMKDMRFIYAEMVFLERWWAELDEGKRARVKSLLHNGQLEIVTGGWVMTDEANSHYFANIAEMMEGHEWISNTIGNYTPSSHWSIDPFGLSPTMTFLMSKANLSNALIQRVHYSVKKHLAEKKQLEFYWRQLWSGNDESNDMFTHVMPFYSYDIPHTCGPDPKVCCQFDFQRIASIGCPWNIPPVMIDANNVGERAELLYDQYRKKAQLYSSNVLFIPLGDDFRYQTEGEWKIQHDNYAKLFDFMNNNKDWNVNARFGTLGDYFKLDHQRIEESRKNDGTKVPILSGDFFTYADRNDHYWSGYYTSRPFYKQMDRVLQHYVRSAEIVYSMVGKAWSLPNKGNEMYGLLVESRRNMSLFQHHDGVTGTAKDNVVLDYANKMLASLNNCEEIITTSSGILLGDGGKNGEKMALKMSETRPAQNRLPKKTVVNEESEVVLFNSLAQERREVVCMEVKSVKSQVIRQSKPDIPVPQQLAPTLSTGFNGIVIKNDTFEHCFMAIVPAFGLEKYRLTISGSGAQKAGINSKKPLKSAHFTVDEIPGTSFELDNELFEAKFDGQTGLLQSVKPNGESSEVAVNVTFVKYGVRGKNPGKFQGGDDLSGAYLFLPNGPATVLDTKEAYQYIVIEGPIMKKVFVAGPSKVKLVQTATIYEGSPYIELQNDVNIEQTHNFELAMRLVTSVKNADELYTDLNGYQVILRKRFAKLPLQAHFYPMPGSAFIEDESTRVCLLGAQTLGVASLESGWMEVMLDRRLNQDDGRGLFAGVTDNIRSRSTFRLLVEPLVGSPRPENIKTAYHSLAAHYASLQLHYPLMVMLRTGNFEDTPASYSGVSTVLPCDIHAVTLRTMASPTQYTEGGIVQRVHTPSTKQALILHRLGVDCRSKLPLLMKCSTSEGKVKVSSLLRKKPSRISETSLTLLYDEGTVDEVNIEPMDLRTFKLDFDVTN